jgi:hypothetical protein
VPDRQLRPRFWTIWTLRAIWMLPRAAGLPAERIGDLVDTARAGAPCRAERKPGRWSADRRAGVPVDMQRPGVRRRRNATSLRRQQELSRIRSARSYPRRGRRATVAPEIEPAAEVRRS